MNKSGRLVAIMSVVLLCAVFAVSKCFAPDDDAGKDKAKNINDSNEPKNSNGEDSSEEDCITVVLDAGHGGVDPGKVGVDGQLEKDINLQITLKLKEILENDKDMNIKVVLTREEDMGHYSESDSNKKMADMIKRCDIANSSGAALLVSIHQNSYHSSSVKGAQVFYYEASEKGKLLAHSIQNSLVEQLAENGKGRVEKANDNYYILLNVECPAVIVECGFLSNPEEAASLTDSTYQERIATAIADGVRTYLNKDSALRNKNFSQ